MTRTSCVRQAGGPSSWDEEGANRPVAFRSAQITRIRITRIRITKKTT